MIDTHVHLFPDDVVWRFYVWVERKHSFSPGMRMEWQKALGKLREMGVRGIFNLTHAITPDMTPKLAEWQVSLKGRLEAEGIECYTFTGFHPENDLNLLYEVFEAGIDGLKLHPSVQKFYPNSKRALEIYEVLEELKKPLYIHSGYFPDNAYEFSSPELYEELIHSFSMPVILAHMIVGKTRSVADFFDARRNVYADTSNAFVRIEFTDPVSGERVRFFSEEVVEVVREYPDRILYGSEIPIVWWRPEETFESMRDNLDDELVERITVENPKKFISRWLA
ncbi:amidohydrolase family protein [Geoglobus ahangari]